MYASFFGLKQDPFSIAPDPRYLYMSERHREALAHLLYGVKGGGGFVLLSGEIGAGKTTVCRCFLEQIPKRCNVAYIFNPKMTAEELLQTVCQEFHIPAQHEGAGAPTLKDHVDALNAYLLRTHAVGQNNVLIIDEAQNLSPEVLEQLRLLTNLETSERKLLQIILIGQPELRSMLARPELEQLAQRVIARYHLEALSRNETEAYIRHRLAVAGRSGPLPFDRGAVKRIHQRSRGVPRRINLLCDRALLGAYAEGRPVVDRRIVDRATDEVFDKPAARWSPPESRSRTPRWSTPMGLATALVAGVAAFAVVAWALEGGFRQAPARAAAAAATAGSAAPRPVAASSVPVGAARGQPSASAPAGPEALEVEVPATWTSEREAWRHLALRWGLPAETEGCGAAQRHAVHCHRGTATLELLRRLDRPSVLTLHQPGGAAGYAVLRGWEGERLRLQGPDGVQLVPVAALAGRWRGEFSTLYRTPPGHPGLAGDEDNRAVNRWLAAQLAAVPGASQAGPLSARVAAFQLAQGLKPDGRPGPVTYMQLNRALGVEEPRLQTPK